LGETPIFLLSPFLQEEVQQDLRERGINKTSIIKKQKRDNDQINSTREEKI